MDRLGRNPLIPVPQNIHTTEQLVIPIKEVARRDIIQPIIITPQKLLSQRILRFKERGVELAIIVAKSERIREMTKNTEQLKLFDLQVLKLEVLKCERQVESCKIEKEKAQLSRRMWRIRDTQQLLQLAKEKLALATEEYEKSTNR